MISGKEEPAKHTGVSPDDLRLDDPGYDGTQFALEYRRARMAGN